MKLKLAAAVLGLGMAALAVSATVSAQAPGEHDDVLSLDCTDTSTVAGTPDPKAGQPTPEEALKLAAAWPVLGEGGPELFADPKIVGTPDGVTGNDNPPRIHYALSLDGRTVALVTVERLDELQQDSWFLIGFTSCSPLAGTKNEAR